MHDMTEIKDKKPETTRKNPSARASDLSHFFSSRTIKQLNPKHVGYVVLAFGLGAFLFVFSLGIGKWYGVGPFSSLKKRVGTRAELAAFQDLAAPSALSQSREQEAFVPPRDRDLDPARIEGQWQAEIGEYLGLLSVKGGGYQILLAPIDPSSARIYSSGTYTFKEGLLVLSPRLDWPAPHPPSAQQEIPYRNLTLSSFPFLVIMDGSAMLWSNPLPDEPAIYVPQKNPLFLTTNLQTLSWTKVR